LLNGRGTCITNYHKKLSLGSRPCDKTTLKI
jgi:hypothetical protein